LPDSPSVGSEQPDATRSNAGRRSIARFLLRPIGLLIGLALLFPAAAASPEPAQAGGSCTGWGSTTVPPNTIRVLRKSGYIETVDFKRYVNVVMGKEWGSRLPFELLKAGAQASKQYAWYWTLEGKHRSSYFYGGKCYDVKDTTADQLYKPETAIITDKHRDAVDAIWGLSLRKSGKFIMTQYAYGKLGVECGADYNGKKLFERSAKQCAKAGWSFSRILAKYYGPDISETWNDGSASGSASSSTSFKATVSVPRSLFRTGSSATKAPVLVTWEPTSGASAISKYQVQRRVSGVWNNLGGQPASDTDYDLNVNWGTAQKFRVRAKNSSGTAGAWSTGPSFTPVRVDDRSSAVSWSGSWTRKSDSSAVKGTTTMSKQAGASVTYKFTGRAIALVATKGPGRGKANIYVNGNLQATVDLYKSTKQSGRVVYSRSWAKSATRTVKVVVAGTSGRPRVDIDAFLAIR
jgi:hypothetical protein